MSFLCIVSILSALLLGPVAYALPDFSRDALRYELENRLNELDLIIRNQGASQADIRWQKREAIALRLTKRIPKQDRFLALEQELRRSARGIPVKVLSVERLVIPERAPAPVPAWVYIDDPPFRFQDNQLVETVRFSMAVRGSSENIKHWVAGWRDGLERLVMVDALTRRDQGSDIWVIHGRAYRFRSVMFPRLVWRDPGWLLKERRLSNDALLNSILRKIRTLAPRTGPFYEVRRDFLLNQTRLDFLKANLMKNTTLRGG